MRGKLESCKEICDDKFSLYSSELDKIVGNKRGVFPEFVLDNVEVEGTSRSTLMENAGMISDSDPITQESGSGIAQS